MTFGVLNLVQQLRSYQDRLSLNMSYFHGLDLKPPPQRQEPLVYVFHSTTKILQA